MSCSLLHSMGLSGCWLREAWDVDWKKPGWKVSPPYCGDALCNFMPLTQKRSGYLVPSSDYNVAAAVSSYSAAHEHSNSAARLVKECYLPVHARIVRRDGRSVKRVW